MIPSGVKFNESVTCSLTISPFYLSNMNILLNNGKGTNGVKNLCQKQVVIKTLF